ncbi:regulatory LuxR family protein [Kribbella sp. VKM Ac-2568]|nr:regulatory LuxR family protein [Kribbella sp. VKM Ac-2568]
MPLIDLVLRRLAGREPIILVVDDLQWADQSSLDVLAYLIASDPYLTVLATCRDEDRADGHPLHGWLADLHRLPHFREIRLQRLTPEGTEAQLHALFGRPPDVALAAQLHERSQGNPYLTQLLAVGLSGVERELPRSTPIALRDALLASWHSLSAPARQLTRVLAAAGQPTELRALVAVAQHDGIVPAAVADLVSEARDHGVIQMEDRHQLWFRHPLLAEVLYGDLLPDQVVRLAAAYADVLAAEVTSTGAAALAIHCRRAGRFDEAFRWTMAAVEHAERLPAPAETALHLENACALWDQVSPALRGTPQDHLDLLVRTAGLSGVTGRMDTAIPLADQALGMMDRSEAPLQTAELILTRAAMAWRSADPGKAVIATLLEAEELTKPYPDSDERAHCFAALAFAEHWESLHREAIAHAEEAVQIARRSGSPLAQCVALSARACAHQHEVESNVLTDAQEAEELGRSLGSVDLIFEPALYRVWRLNRLGRRAEATELARRLSDEMHTMGARGAYYFGAVYAEGLIHLGRWAESAEVLRAGLAARPVEYAGSAVRLTAARLAARRGQLDEARQHLDRALELTSADFDGMRNLFSLVVAEVLLAEGQAAMAVDWLRPRLPVPADDLEDVGGELLVVFAAAAAEVAQAARDAGGARSCAVDARGDVPVAGLLSALPYEPFVAVRTNEQAMWKAMFAAESARCRGDPDQITCWAEVVEAAEHAGAPWEEAVARLRLVAGALAAGVRRSDVGEQLRQAHHQAVRLGAARLRERAEALARQARVSLREPAAVTDEQSEVLGFLTSREREILGFLVAGRSNGEIARELVISAKTVSVHVSSILKKTGTANRVEAAAYAERVGGLDG